MNNKSIFYTALICLFFTYIGCERTRSRTFLNSSAKIHSFLIDSFESEIKEDSIKIKVSFGTNIKNLYPIINISEGAEVTPKSGIKQDFSFPVKYKVVAENGISKEYTVCVFILPNTESEIKYFIVDFQKANIQSTNINLDLNPEYNLTNIKPIIKLSPKASVKPKSGEAIDFSFPQTYTVTAEDGSTTDYTVNIELESYLEYAENDYSIRIKDKYLEKLETGKKVNFQGLEYTIASKEMIQTCLTEDGMAADLEYYITSKITDMSKLFRKKTSFDTDISHWDVSNIKDMSYMFENLENSELDISKWDVSNVVDMSFMFHSAYKTKFDIKDWDVSNVENMSYMFGRLSDFNLDISNWNVSNVINMEGMFKNAEKFNQNIGKWDVSNANNMASMFRSAETFNQNISKWDVSKVTDMYLMFYGASNFNQNLSKWDVGNVKSYDYAFTNCPLENEPTKLPDFKKE